MRPLYAVGGVVLLMAGFAAWAAMGLQTTTAQEPPPPAPPPEVLPDVKPPTPPGSGIRPIPKSRPNDELFELPPTNPRALPADAGPVPALDNVEVPDVPGVKPPSPRIPGDGKSPSNVKPTVFIPTRDPDRDVRGSAVVTAAPSAAAPVSQLAFQEPMVRLEWQGSPTLQLGAATEYTLVARNTSSIALNKVIVQVKVPTGAKVSGTQPKAEGSGSVLMWDLGTMESRQDKTVKMSFVAPEKGEINCQAWVTITGSASFKADVREAKLAIATKAPQRVAAGEPLAIAFIVTNPGDHPAESVKLSLTVPEGMEIKAGSTNLFDLGKIAPGEAREVKVPTVAKGSGTHKIEARVDGNGGVKATTALTITATKARLDVALTGPKLRYIDRKAAYSIKLTNNGDATASEVLVSHQVPPGFKFLAADSAGKFDASSRSIVWAVGEMGVGESREIKCELLAAAVGEYAHKISVGGERGVRSEASMNTKIEALSAMSMDVGESDDPVEVGADTTYEVRVSNTGSKDETDIKVVCAIPAQMKFKAARGPGKFEVVGNEVVFEPLDKLPSRTEVSYRVTLTAKEKGDAKFKATMNAKGMSEPLVHVESTKIYAD